MENTLAEVEHDIFAGLHRIEELRCAIVQQHAQLESCRRLLRRNLCALAALQKPDPKPSLNGLFAAPTDGSSGYADPLSATQRERMDILRAVANGAQHEWATRTVSEEQVEKEVTEQRKTQTSGSVSCSQDTSTQLPSILRLSLNSLSFSAPGSLLQSPKTDYSLYTQAFLTRATQSQARSFFHAAKLQFAEEWARLALPWFDQVVQHQFFLPLLKRLESFEKRLCRLCARMSLDLPQYTLHGKEEEEVVDGSTRDARCASRSAQQLWRCYVTTATQKQFQGPPPPQHCEINSGIAVETAECPCAARMRSEIMGGKDSTVGAAEEAEGRDEEEVVIVAPTAVGDDVALREALVHTPRSLRHIWHVMRYGLTESSACASGSSPHHLSSSSLVERERVFGSEDDELTGLLQVSISRLASFQRQQGRCDRGRGVSEDKLLSLRCHISQLLQRYTALTSHLDWVQRSKQVVNLSSLLKDADYSRENSALTLKALAALLTFFQYVGTLHKALHDEYGACSPSQSQGDLKGKKDDVDLSLVTQNTTEQSPCTQRQTIACLEPDNACPSLIQLLLLPFHLLHSSLLPLIEAVQHNVNTSQTKGANKMDDPSVKVSAAKSACHAYAMGDDEAEHLRYISAVCYDIVPFVRWWASPSACDCRCVYARLLDFATTYHFLLPEARESQSSEEGLASNSRTSFALSPAARLYRLRNAELHIRELWEELRAKLLIARSIKSP